MRWAASNTGRKGEGQRTEGRGHSGAASRAGNRFRFSKVSESLKKRKELIVGLRYHKNRKKCGRKLRFLKSQEQNITAHNKQANKKTVFDTTSRLSMSRRNEEEALE